MLCCGQLISRQRLPISKVRFLIRIFFVYSGVVIDLRDENNDIFIDRALGIEQ